MLGHSEPPSPGTGPAFDAAVGVLDGRRVLALTGAGLSTDSGIPDYRGPRSVPRQPMTYQEFTSGPEAQQRYWARSHVGWSRMHTAAPNPGHRAFVALEAAGVVQEVITQNVDGLHQAAGSHRVVDLHGRIADVVCSRCGEVTARAALHERLTALNPAFTRHRPGVSPRPDGDAEVLDVSGFRLASCLVCRGALKPDVVFFGENVPPDRVAHCYAAVQRAEVLLVAGTSLTVQSGLRFVRRAHREGVPVVLVNNGPTRGDTLMTVRLSGGCSPVLTALAAALTTGISSAPACPSLPGAGRSAPRPGVGSAG